MDEYRYTLAATRPDGAVVDLAQFKVRDLAEALLKVISQQYKGVSFQVDDVYKEKSLGEILTDDDNFV